MAAERGANWDDEETTPVDRKGHQSGDNSLTRQPTLTPKAGTQNSVEGLESGKTILAAPRNIDSFVEKEDEARVLLWFLAI
jgi:hypothetical protein